MAEVAPLSALFGEPALSEAEGAGIPAADAIQIDLDLDCFRAEGRRFATLPPGPSNPKGGLNPTALAAEIPGLRKPRRPGQPHSLSCLQESVGQPAKLVTGNEFPQ